MTDDIIKAIIIIFIAVLIVPSVCLTNVAKTACQDIFNRITTGIYLFLIIAIIIGVIAIIVYGYDQGWFSSGSL